ncbi:hypothetical protein OS493_032276 [Desmophyllum pertusum]|uniref:6-phosphofructokinase n=1 Tax=Desmophyllum pertusum TaxID=174260 RepID=A0A9X0CX92_9CNID|nr:hypothetical protein OS493_032276 [Desmophyllum pertusum]
MCLALAKESEYGWLPVADWAVHGDPQLGTKRCRDFANRLLLAPSFRTLPSKDLQKVAESSLPITAIQGLLVIVGFENLPKHVTSSLRSVFHGDLFPLPSVTMSLVTDLSLGADTALNVITETNIEHLVNKKGSVRRGLIIRNEKCSDNYTTDFIAALYREEGEGLFTVRTNVLGHVQQGGSPSPFDRIQATRQATLAVNWLTDKIAQNITDEGSVETSSPDTACLLGIKKASNPFTPVQELKLVTDFKHRIPRDQWWLDLRPCRKFWPSITSTSSTIGRTTCHLSREAHVMCT